jgi:hypothetical protein
MHPSAQEKFASKIAVPTKGATGFRDIDPEVGIYLFKPEVVTFRSHLLNVLLNIAGQLSAFNTPNHTVNKVLGLASLAKIACDIRTGNHCFC